MELSPYKTRATRTRVAVTPVWVAWSGGVPLRHCRKAELGSATWAEDVVARAVEVTFVAVTTKAFLTGRASVITVWTALGTVAIGARARGYHDELFHEGYPDGKGVLSSPFCQNSAHFFKVPDMAPDSGDGGSGDFLGHFSTGFPRPFWEQYVVVGHGAS